MPSKPSSISCVYGDRETVRGIAASLVSWQQKRAERGPTTPTALVSWQQRAERGPNTPTALVSWQQQRAERRPNISINNIISQHRPAG